MTYITAGCCNKYYLNIATYSQSLYTCYQSNSPFTNYINLNHLLSWIVIDTESTSSFEVNQYFPSETSKGKPTRSNSTKAILRLDDVFSLYSIKTKMVACAIFSCYAIYALIESYVLSRSIYFRIAFLFHFAIIYILY